uniref:Endonuclease domain-containing 1 protein-like n=1 Tax=Xenopus tropicalis TaxID=8364 RepID=A0A803JVL7_XENTR
MKMMLSLAWLLIAIAHKAEPLISEHFNVCRDVFYRGQLPQGFHGIALPHRFNPSDLPDGIKAEELTSPAYICQQYGNQYHFASLYDRGRRVPLYSAYILEKRPTDKPTNKRPGFFNIEPRQYGNQYHFASLYDRGRRGPLNSAYILGRRPSDKPNYKPRFFNIEPQEPQQYGNQYHYASLYDRGRRGPFYSAYILDRINQEITDKLTNHRPGFFTIEPQLIYRGLSGTMSRERDTRYAIIQYNKDHGIDNSKEKNRPSYLIPTSQADDDDYTNSGYERGHVNPNGHHVGGSEEKATFTLTNVVPMTKKLNTDIWNKYEKNLTGYADGCKTMYVVTGIVPSNDTWIKGDRVNIPSHVWNAYCCVDNNDKPIKSGAGLRENDYSNHTVNEMKINELQVQLKNLLGTIAIFQNNCA